MGRGRDSAQASEVSHSKRFILRASRLRTDEAEVQRLFPPMRRQRMEGVAFCDNGRVIGSALSDSREVCLFRREPGSPCFETDPFFRLRGPASRMDYPHDLAFSLNDDGRLLAVALRTGVVLVFERNDADGTYGLEPVCEISGPESGLQYSDGVAFVPPHGDALAVCNLPSSKVSFHRRADEPGSTRFEQRPCFVMQHNGISQPDGLAFSSDGRWLAVSNHGNHTVAIYQRAAEGNGPSYDPRPLVILQDNTLRYPHSLAFTPRHNHLVVSNAGANYASVYLCTTRRSEEGETVHWSVPPLQKILTGYDKVFAEVNACNKKEGGPKGVAAIDGFLAICRPETGLTVYRMQEHPECLALEARGELPLDAVPRRRAGYTLAPTGGDRFAIQCAGEDILRLNDPGVVVWELCSGDRTLSEVIETLQETFPDADSVANDVRTIVASLQDAQAIDVLESA
jgi:hypothetical protein